MLASGGYPWTIVPLERRMDYMVALEQASVDDDIKPFAKLLADLGERPSPKGEGFVLRLKPLIVGHAADAQAQTTRKLSSGDSGFWSSIYFFQTSSVTFPLLATQYPRAHKC